MSERPSDFESIEKSERARAHEADGILADEFFVSEVHNADPTEANGMLEQARAFIENYRTKTNAEEPNVSEENIANEIERMKDVLAAAEEPSDLK